MIDGKKIVALCTYRVYDPQLFEFITELNELLKSFNSRLFIYTMNSEIGNSGDYEAEAHVYDLIQYDKTDIVVIMDEKIKCREIVQHIIDKSNENDVPTIVIDGDYEKTTLVKFDYRKGFENVARHIIEYHKVKRPHFMAGKRNSAFSDERIAVFKEILQDNNIPFEENMLSYGDFWSDPSRAEAQKLLRREQLPQAIICANDIMAINVCDVFAEGGVKTPDDVLISGFDGIDEAFLSTPGITTAICDNKQLAASVVEAINGVFDGKKEITWFIEPRFIPNESCGCPRCNLSSISAVSALNNRFYHHQDDIHKMQTLTSKIMASEKVFDFIVHIREAIPENMCIVVENACFGVEKNYYLEDVEKTTQSIIYNSRETANKVVRYDCEKIIPDLDEILEKGYPIIFNELEYMGKTTGFVCYSFERYDLIDYTKTPAMTNCISMGISGFITRRYQNYLRDKIQKMYQYDGLTNLYNRLAFLSIFNELKEEPSNIGKTMTIIMADLNGLKKINDTYGHVAGDQAIATVAKELKAACPYGSICVRYGGDEMLALVLGDCSSSDIIYQIEDKLQEHSENLGYTISSSFGAYTTVFDKNLDLDTIIGIADEQMYRMKKRKRR
ncbi:MAG: GGDEF domain-containing protein [Butyrivibrio sp.]|nr:GGDEF domain-containing protein [Butyrivibrio sp.]